MDIPFVYAGGMVINFPFLIRST